MAGRPRTLAPFAWASGLLLVLAGCYPAASAEESAELPSIGSPVETVDLVAQDWAHVPGVTASTDGLQVTATDFRIVGPDGRGGQAAPPVNLAGTHLAVSGNVAVSATVVDRTGAATLLLVDRPPVVADEFRLEPPGLRLTVDDDHLLITVFDGSVPRRGTAPVPVHKERVPLTDPSAPLTIARIGEVLLVGSGGRTIAEVPPVLTSGELWLGLAGSFRVSSFTAGGLDGGTVRAVGPAVDAVDAGQDPAGLQALAAAVRPGFLVGAAVALGPLAADPDYAGAVLADLGSVTPENAMKPQSISPRRGEYTFAEADAVVDAARRHGLAVHGHTLAFGEALPRWMQELPTGTAAERQASGEVLLDYVRTVSAHFRGRLDSVDVVNEPLDPDQGPDLQENLWYRALGPDYPALVSRAVADADPDVVQFVNENGAEADGERQDALLDLVARTNARGGSIDGVGLQAHVYDLDTDRIDGAELNASLDRFAAAGLAVRISENDVTDAEGTDVQAAQYAEVFAACLAHPACVSYTTWGVDDRYDWYVDDSGRVRQGHDLLRDDGVPTPAYEAIREVLRP